MNLKMFFLLFAASLGLISAQWLWPGKDGSMRGGKFSEKVNLALRQAGHQLLTIQGDRTSTIYPIKIKSENEFVLRLDHSFNYDDLPYVLHTALTDYGISENYHVAIRNCETDTLILGYNLLSYERKEVACSERRQWAPCNDISVVFEREENEKFSAHILFLILGLVGFSFFMGLYFSKNKKAETKVEKDKKDNELIKIGNTHIDHKNQCVIYNGENKSLTFRENKLLHYFAARPNEILEREKILSEVWEDEGVIVGRSLDVFVSRLRKILKEDASLKIKNVHGVGYRLEVG